MRTAFRIASGLIPVLVTVLTSNAAQAAELSSCTYSHPAIAHRACAVAGIDSDTFLVQPPASTRWLAKSDAPVVHANYAHPAVAVARMQKTAGIDANTFLVQPPVTVSWTVVAPEPVYAVVPVAAPTAR